MKDRSSKSNIKRESIEPSRTLAWTKLVEIIYETSDMGWNLRRVLGRASPLSGSKTGRGLSTDLGSLCMVARVHEEHVQEILTLSFPKQREKLGRLVREIESNWFASAADHMQTLRKPLARFRKDLAKPTRLSAKRRAKRERGERFESVAMKKLLKFVYEIGDIQTKLKRALRRASPLSAPKTITWLSVDLAGLRKVGQVHEEHVQEIPTLSFPRDREKLRELALEIQVNWFSWAADHMRTLRQMLPRLRNDLAKAARFSAKRRTVQGRS